MMRLIPYMAWRHLCSRLRSTLLVAAGVALGVAVMSVMSSMMLGLQGQFIENILDTSPAITIEGVRVGAPPRPTAIPPAPGTIIGLSRRPPPDAEEDITGYRRVIAQVRQLPEVVAAAPVLEGNVVLRYGTRARPVLLTGIDPVLQAQTVAWTPRLQEQRGTLEMTSAGVILGVEGAKRLGVPPGARVTIVAGPERRQRMRVIGYYASGVRTVDERAAYVNLSTAQTLLDRPSAVSAIAVRITNPREAPALAQAIQAATGLRARSWQEVNQNFFAIFRLQNTMTTVMIAFIVLISGFGIANGLITLILEKQREIGILKALGVTTGRIGHIFLLEGVLMGLLGAVAGMGLAALGIHYLDTLPLRGDGELSTASTFTMLRVPGVYLIPAAVAVGVSVLASLIPVRLASRFDPVTIIRNAK